jgi:hypothetical protein
MTDLPKYHSFPPLTPHEPNMSARDVASLKATFDKARADESSYGGCDEDKAASLVYEAYDAATALIDAIDFPAADTDEEVHGWTITDGGPTPTIPQMTDRHERQVFTDKAERVVNKVLAFALTVLAVVFVGGLMYKTFVWGH